MKRFEISDLNKGAHIHFIGIGGISMSGLATILLQNGYKISGSDRQKSHITKKLEDNGAVIFLGHDAKNVKGADLVVHTAAIHEDNPEYQQAIKDNILLIDRAECLGAIMKLYKIWNRGYRFLCSNWSLPRWYWGLWRKNNRRHLYWVWKIWFNSGLFGF